MRKYILLAAALLLLLSCSANDPLRYAVPGSLELEFIPASAQQNWPAQFSAHLVITAEPEAGSFDPLEKDLTIKLEDSTYRASEVVEVPVGLPLFITVTATFSGETWSGQTVLSLAEGQTQTAVIQLTLAQPNIVSFPDSLLEAAVRQAINKPIGDILVSDINTLDTLEASQLGIADLSGMEYMSSLSWVNLAFNQISDLIPLTGLTALSWLDLTENQVSELQPLVNNPGLGTGDELWLEFNPLGPNAFNDQIPQLIARGVIVHY